MGSGSDTSVDNSNASGASDKTGTESDNVVMVGGSFEKDGLKGTVNDADNESCDQSFIASVNEFTGDTLSTGRKINFSVVFAVPVDAESIELEYTANIWSSEKVIIKLQEEE